MPILIQEAHDFIRSIIKKNKGGFVSPADIDRAVNRGVSDWMSAVIYKYKKSGKFDYDHMFVKKKTYTVTLSTGTQAINLTDYVEALTIYLKGNDQIIREGTVYDWDKFLEFQNSAILVPDQNFPVSTIFVSEAGVQSIQFLPVPTSGSLEYTLMYMRKPIKGFYNYTTSSGNITYNPTGSIDIDIDDRYFTDIMTRALMYLGISLKDGDIASTEAMKDNNQRSDER